MEKLLIVNNRKFYSGRQISIGHFLDLYCPTPKCVSQTLWPLGCGLDDGLSGLNDVLSGLDNGLGRLDDGLGGLGDGIGGFYGV